MKIQFIFTFEDSEQIITHYKRISPVFLDSKNIFIHYAFEQLDEWRETTLIKISACINTDSPITLPKWYDECKGKIWIDDLEPFRKDNGIDSNVSNEYINEFMAANNLN